MIKVIVHAGMQKTASTEIQKHFSMEREYYKEKGILYPLNGRFEGNHNHHALFSSLCDDLSYVRTPLPKPRLKFDDYVKLIREEIEESQPDTILLSSEMVWNPKAFPVEKLQRFKEAFDPYQVQTFFYLRSIESHAKSGFAQRITGPQKYSGTFKSHIADSLENDTWRYGSRVTDFINTFTKERVFVCWYDSAKEYIYNPIFHVLNIKEGNTNTKTYSLNQRRGWTYVYLIRILNKTPLLKDDGLHRKIVKRGCLLVDKFIRALGAEYYFQRKLGLFDSEHIEKLSNIQSEEREKVEARIDTGWCQR